MINSRTGLGKGANEPARQSALWSVRETADYLAVSDKTIRRWIQTGRLAAYRAGKQIRISPSAVHDCLTEA